MIAFNIEMMIMVWLYLENVLLKDNGGIDLPLDLLMDVVAVYMVAGSTCSELLPDKQV